MGDGILDDDRLITDLFCKTKAIAICIEGEILEINNLFLQIFDYSCKEKIIGKTIEKFLYDPSYNSLNRQYNQKNQKKEIQGISRYGRIFPILLEIRSIVDEDRNLDLFLIEELPERHISIKYRSGLNETVSIEEFELYRNFVFAITHQLNNKLLPIVYAEEILRQNLSNPYFTTFLNIIENSNQEILNIIRQLLTFVGNVKLNLELLTTEELIELVKKSIQQPDKINWKIAKNLPLIKVDLNLMSIAICNLIENSIEATKNVAKPKITVSFSMKDCQTEGTNGFLVLGRIDDGTKLNISISDNGDSLIHRNYFSLIFPSSQTKFVGKGLNIASTTGIVLSHHGYTKLKFNKMKGSRLEICIPSK